MVECEPTVAELQAELERRRQAAPTIAPAERPQFDTARFLDSPEADRKAAEAAERERQSEVQRRVTDWHSFCDRRGGRYAGCTLDGFQAVTTAQREAVACLRSYRDAIKDRIGAGINVLLFGPVGTGKDHLLIDLAHAAIAHGFRVAWHNGMDLFGMFRDSMDGDTLERVLIDRLIKPDVLYLSDPVPPIGKLNEWRMELLFRVIDARYSRGKPIWVTVNVPSREELAERLGVQSADRLRDGALAVFCDWPSHRKVQD